MAAKFAQAHALSTPRLPWYFDCRIKAKFDLASGTPLLWDEQRALLQTPVESSVDAG